MEPQIIGRYQIKHELGRGGMSTVYLAFDPRMKREVVVKVLPAYFMHDPTFRNRFEHEAQVVASLEHSAVVPVYDFGEEQGQPYLVMRYMAGGSLADRITQGALPIEEIVPILKRIGSALDYAHTWGIVHRDLKPGNILFDQLGEAYLADFGIARMLEGNAGVTATGVLVGTPAYMSPEQAQGIKVDGRSDLYSLGIIVFEMLTGRKPFQADTPMGVVWQQIQAEPPRIQEVRSDLPPIVGRVMDKTLAKKRDERYANGASLVAALESALFNAPPTLVYADQLLAVKPATSPPVTRVAEAPSEPVSLEKTAEPPPSRPKIRPEAGGPIIPKRRGWPAWGKWSVMGLAGMGMILLFLRFGNGFFSEVTVPTSSPTATATVSAVPTQPPPTSSATALPTATERATATKRPPTPTRTPHLASPTSEVTTTHTATATRRMTLTPTGTAVLPPTNTPLPENAAPSATVRPTNPPPTNTPSPEPTDTPEPLPTNTPVPPPTNTPVPPPTNTPAPIPSDTPVPPPTNTPVPPEPPTNTPVPP